MAGQLTYVSLAPPLITERDRWGRRISTPEMKEVTVTARTASRPTCGDEGHSLCPLGALRAVPAHRVGRGRRPRRCREPRLDASARPAGTYRAELSWTGSAGSAAAVASALRGWNHLRFEITEEPTPSSEGARYSYTPELGVFHAVTGLHGDIMIPEDRLKAAVVKAALGDTTLLERDRQAARQAVGRRAGDLPARRRGRAGALAAPGRLSRSDRPLTTYDEPASCGRRRRRRRSSRVGADWPSAPSITPSRRQWAARKVSSPVVLGGLTRTVAAVVTTGADSSA